MFDQLKATAAKQGDALRLLPIERMADLRQDLADFQNEQNLNGFQQYIVNRLYQLEPPETDFAIRSIIIIASPTPAYAKVNLAWRGQTFSTRCLAPSAPDRPAAGLATEQYLTQLLEPTPYRIHAAPWLPRKRLAARSGLAKYGRNNICYVEGMGSFLTLVTYYSDIPCQTDVWQDIQVIGHCQNCTACLKNCPTEAISQERFLINNERCLSYFNERADAFPDWLPQSAHHCLYDCLMCQLSCPQNNNYIHNIIGPIEFDEVETELLLSGKTITDLPPALQAKVQFLGMDQWFDAIPRNMKVLIDNDELG